MSACRIIGSLTLAMSAAAWADGASAAGEASVRPLSGMWRAWLDSPGGELPFGLELRRSGDEWSASLINGPESIAVPSLQIADANELRLIIDHYDATVSARVTDDGASMNGQWVKTGSGGTQTRLNFHAVHGDLPRFTPIAARDGAPQKQDTRVTGRWRMIFSKSDDPDVGLFRQDANGIVNGSILTSTGDYRYLAGSCEAGRLRLSCFDGAHAFLFDATLQPDGSLRGDFWSRDAWHETFTATRDEHAELPDAFAMTRWTGSAPVLNTLAYPDVNGVVVSLGDDRFAGKPRILEIFGTWCPNCYDASRYLTELHHKYADRGLSIIGLAFEHTGDFSRDARQVRRYVDRLKIPYTVLIGGVSDKARASAAFPVLDQIRAYPTTVLVDRSGRAVAVYTGFSGPATGDAYEWLRTEFEQLIEEMLADEDD